MGTDAGQATPVGFDEELFADAWDIYFPAPLSLSLVANTFAHNGMQGELGQLLDLHDGQADAIAADLQRLVAEPPGARLDIIPIAHHSVPRQQAMHLHAHVYVARTVLEPSTGERRSVAREELATAALTAWRRYTGRLRVQTTAVLGFGWDPPPNDPASGRSGDRGDEVRIARLPRAVHVTKPEFCVCHGYLGPHEQIIAEGHNLGSAARASRTHRAHVMGDPPGTPMTSPVM